MKDQRDREAVSRAKKQNGAVTGVEKMGGTWKGRGGAEQSQQQQAFRSSGPGSVGGTSELSLSRATVRWSENRPTPRRRSFDKD